MKLVQLLLGILLLGTAVHAGDLDLSFLHSGYQSIIDEASTELETLLLEDKLEFSGESRSVLRDAWKTCRSTRDSYTANKKGALDHMVSNHAYEKLNGVASALDTLVYDQLIRFKNDAAKASYRNALRKIRDALVFLD